ncbi:MAG: DUF72 domain-containing protein [Pseudomonadota bacterium]
MAITVGTASWTEPSLIKSKSFYPPLVKSAEARLRFYASHFDLTEVDSSYYALPSARNARLWVERTPDRFQFNIKSYRLFSLHQTPPNSLPRDILEALGSVEKKNLYYKDIPEELRDELWERFRMAIEPLRIAGKLVAVHFQFSPWTAYHPQNFSHIEECMAQLPGCQLAIEFRHKSWFEGKHAASTLAFERDRHLTHAIVDEPQVGTKSIPAVWEITNEDLAVIRLHGRNHETWNKKGLSSSAERFNYDYSTAELEELATNIEKISQQVNRTQTIFNNNYENQGQRNALELMRILRQRGAAIENRAAA